ERLESRPNWQTRMSAPRTQPCCVADQLRNSGSIQFVQEEAEQQKAANVDNAPPQPAGEQ
ncbi:MAG TPA: hypothetical protein VFS12_03850, partial [Terriglobia bacterium]|nr:hypothetical protein [Terriglobia bacterium]